MAYTQYGRFKFDHVAKHIGKTKYHFYSKVADRTFLVRMNCQRMQLLGRSQKCAACGIKGTFFILEQSGCFPPHFNLYATETGGKELLMTMDHIVPKSKGGKTVPENLQVMCSRCNGRKGNRHLSKKELKQLGDRVRTGRWKQIKKKDDNDSGRIFGQVQGVSGDGSDRSEI